MDNIFSEIFENISRNYAGEPALFSAKQSQQDESVENLRALLYSSGKADKNTWNVYISENGKMSYCDFYKNGKLATPEIEDLIEIRKTLNRIKDLIDCHLFRIEWENFKEKKINKI